jgi:hypothetical protein
MAAGLKQDFTYDNIVKAKKQLKATKKLTNKKDKGAEGAWWSGLGPSAFWVRRPETCDPFQAPKPSTSSTSSTSLDSSTSEQKPSTSGTCGTCGTFRPPGEPISTPTSLNNGTLFEFGDDCHYRDRY